MQYRRGEGPCLDAFRQNAVARADDLDPASVRWPAFAGAAREIGIRSALSLPLADEQRAFGTFNLYAEREGAFDGLVEEAAAFAAQAGVVLANARAYDAATRLAANLQRAMDSRAVIEQAKGKLMASSHVDAEQAFEMMRQASQRENVKLRDIATRIVEGSSGPDA